MAFFVAYKIGSDRLLESLVTFFGGYIRLHKEVVCSGP